MREHNFLYLIWKNPQNGRNYTVGKLGKNSKGYFFEYANEYLIAQKDGWSLIQAFPEVKTYVSEEMFPVFSSRLPDRKRRNIQEILNKYGLDSYDGYELLKQSGGRLPIDSYEFVDPIFDEDRTVEREFFVVGIRHSSGCLGKDCGRRPQLSIGMKLLLSLEPTNQYDKYAVQIFTSENELLGYIPRYYSENIYSRLEKGTTYDCTIVELGDDTNCQECVKVKLMMPKRDME